MRILITNTGPWGTGSFTVADALVKQYVQLGHTPLLFFPDTGLPSDLIETYYSNPDLYRVWEFPDEIRGFHFPSFPLIIPDPHPRSDWKMTYKELDQDMFDAFLARTSEKLNEVLDDFQPDIIECQHIWHMNYLLSKQEIPLFCTAHYSDQLGFQYDERSRPLALESLKNTQKVFAVSNYVKKQVEAIYGLPSEKVYAFYNGYDEKVFFKQKLDKQQVLHELGLHLPSNLNFISFAGKISKTKGIDTLMRANSLMHREDIHFLILGGGDYQQFIRATFREGIDTKRIHFLDHQSPERVAKVHNISKLSVLPSRREGFGIACLEAMACGLPLVVTRSGGLPEFVVGSFIEKEDHQAMAEQIIRIVDMDENTYDQLSRKAMNQAKKYSWEDIAKQRLGLYREVLMNNA